MRFRKFILPTSIVLFLILAAGLARAADADRPVDDIERVLSQAREMFSTDRRPVLTGVVLSSSPEDVPGCPGFRCIQVTCEVEWKGERKALRIGVPFQVLYSEGMVERDGLWPEKRPVGSQLGTSNDLELRYLQEYYAPGVKVDVQVDPDRPEGFSLVGRTPPPRTPRKTGGETADEYSVIIWSGLAIVAALVATVVYIHHRVPKLYDSMRAAGWILFFVGLLAIGSVGLWVRMVNPLVKCWMSGSWRETACFIYDSDLVELKETPGGPLNTIRAVYTYPVGQKEYVSRACCFGGEVSDFLDYRNEIRGKLQRHCYARCYVNPSNPADAVLIRSFKWPQGKALLNYFYFAAIWGAGLYGLVLAAWKRIRKRLWGSEESAP